MSKQNEEYDIVVIGCGVAGLAAAASAGGDNMGEPLRIAVLERAPESERGGNSRWTGAYLRLEDVYTPAEGFIDDMARFSKGRIPPEYVATLCERLPETMEWLQALGARFRPLPTIFISKARSRILPVGGGERLVGILADACAALQVEILYETTAAQLLLTEDGDIRGLLVNDPGGQHVIETRTIVIASGGFEGNPEMLVQYLGVNASELKPIAPGGTFNKGEGIRMALGVGAKPTGQWEQFHAEPVDPRSSQPEAVVMIYPYGLLVNRHGQRFVDEGGGTVDETYEEVARLIWRSQDNLAYSICESTVRDIPGYSNGVVTDHPAIIADTIPELAISLGLSAEVLTKTVSDFNAAVIPGQFNPEKPDGLHTEGLAINKTNWATQLAKGPFIAYPITCSIVFTYGGIGTDLDGRVINADDRVIPGLFAAGECTGLYHFKYPGATSVLRGLIYGRSAGHAAANYINGVKTGTSFSETVS